MPFVECCRRRQKAKLYEVKTSINKDKSILEEYILLLDSCKHCGSKAVILYCFDLKGEKLDPVRIKSKKIDAFLRNTEVLKEIKSLNRYILYAGKRFYLNYNKFGRVMKCYQNLSSLKIGLFDHDIDLKYCNTKEDERLFITNPDTEELS